MTKTDRLALLVSGRINVLNDRAFLHHILPGEFLDSPEFESSGLNVGEHGAIGASVEESTFKVTVCAAVPSRCIIWQRNALELLLLKVKFNDNICVSLKNPVLRFPTNLNFFYNSIYILILFRTYIWPP